MYCIWINANVIVHWVYSAVSHTVMKFDRTLLCASNRKERIGKGEEDTVFMREITNY